MAFQLKAQESIKDGITRNIRREFEKLLNGLSAKVKAHDRDAWEMETVHEVRKTFKKVRAALRLVREEIGNDVYHEENFCFRDVARPISEVRDAQMLSETLEKLKGQGADQIEQEVFAKVREALQSNQREVVQRVIREGKAFRTLKELITDALARLSQWKIDQDGWVAMESGLRRVYKEGFRARNLALENPSVGNLHEWRKQAKYLWRQLQLVERAWIDHEKDLGEQIHKVSQLLGDDHDLAVLRQTLAADPLAFGGHRNLKGLITLIDRQRKELERQAFDLGGQFYKDSPKVFTGRIGEYFKAWAFKVPESNKHTRAPAEQRSVS